MWSQECNALGSDLVSLTGDRERCVLLFDQHTRLCFAVLRCLDRSGLGMQGWYYNSTGYRPSPIGWVWKENGELMRFLHG